MKSLVCLLAKGVLVDSQENTVSIFTILEGVEPAGFPFLIQDSAAFVLWAREEGDPATIDLEIKLRNNAREIITAPVRVDFQDKQTSRMIANFKGLRVEEPGIVTVSYEKDGSVLARYEMKVSPASASLAASALGE